MDDGDSEDETLKLNFVVAGGKSSTDLDYLKYENPPKNLSVPARSNLDTRIDYNMTVRTHEGALPKTGLN